MMCGLKLLNKICSLTKVSPNGFGGFKSMKPQIQPTHRYINVYAGIYIVTPRKIEKAHLPKQ